MAVEPAIDLTCSQRQDFRCHTEENMAPISIPSRTALNQTMRLALLLIYFALGMTGRAQTQPAKMPVEDVIVDGKHYSEWLNDIAKWRQDPQSHGAVSNAIVSGARRAEGLLIACLSKEGFSAQKPAEAESIELSRIYAMFATAMLRTNAHWLTDDLLELVRDRGWKGRYWAVGALYNVSPDNPAANSIALEDFKSNDEETRYEGFFRIRQRLESPETLSLVIDATNDRSQKIRSTAIHELGGFVQYPIVVAKLKEISMDASRSQEDRARAEFATNFKIKHDADVSRENMRRFLEKQGK